MANVKILLTPYKQPAVDDDVQALFKQRCSTDYFIQQCFQTFGPHWEKGLKFLHEELAHGTEHKWWHQWKTRWQGYEAVRTIGLYQRDREPSLCIDLNLILQSHASDLLVAASKFGKKFNQSSVHVLFSLKSKVAVKAWDGQNQYLKKNEKGQPAKAYLATFRETIPAQRILSTAKFAKIDALTIHIMGNQLQYHHPVSAKESAKWSVMMEQLKDIPLLKPVEAWDAVLFAIGSGTECKSQYDQWFDKRTKS